MGIFGWDLPPGCSMRDIDNAMGGDGLCDVCGYDVDSCVCPECATCTTVGDPACYEAGGKHFHGLTLNAAQLAGRAKREALDAEQAKADAAESEYWRTHRLDIESDAARSGARTEQED